MDLLGRPTGEPTLNTADLAARENFTTGGVIVSPSTRSVCGPTGNIDVEPRVMQVLVLLAASAGQVVTRETLFDRCWGGVYVGDDSLNRAVAGVRKAIGAVGGRFEVQTIPRTGYRLVVSKDDEADQLAFGTEGNPTRLSRRQLAVASAAVVVSVAGGLSWESGTQHQAEFNALMARGEAMVRNAAGMGDKRAIAIFEQAVSIRPSSARAWGLLGLMRSMAAQAAGPDGTGLLAEAAQDAARKALARDPNEPNALLTMFELEGSTLNWLKRDRTLRQIIAIDPKNIVAISELAALLQAAGLSRESWIWNERALAVEPLSADLLSRRALKLWIAGRPTEADKVIDQARDLNPSNGFVIWVRFLTLALTDRTRAAQAILENDPERIGSRPSVAMWRASLPALDALTPVTIAQAVKACLEAAPLAGQLAAQSVMILSALQQVDAAFDVANGFLLWRGALVRRNRPVGQMQNDPLWRAGVQWLFTPPCSAMRADHRFLALCDGIGLVDYWRIRRIQPDYQRT